MASTLCVLHGLTAVSCAGVNARVGRLRAYNTCSPTLSGMPTLTNAAFDPRCYMGLCRTVRRRLGPCAHPTPGIPADILLLPCHVRVRTHLCLVQGHTEVCVCTCQQCYQLSKLPELYSSREVFGLRIHSGYVRGWSQQDTLMMRITGVCEQGTLQRLPMRIYGDSAARGHKRRIARSGRSACMGTIGQS